MIESIQGAYNGLKAALDIAQGFQSLKTEAAVNTAIIDIQRHVVEAQRALTEADNLHASDLQRITELENEIVRLKDWAGEKERYELKAITPRAYAYVVKPGMENGEDAHWLCQQCFDDSHKGLLQWSGKIETPPGGLGMIAEWRCGRCASSIHVSRNQTPDPRAE